MIDDTFQNKLPTKLWLDGYLRQHALTGQAYYIIHKGESESGTIALKLTITQDNGCRILTQGRNIDGEMGWITAFKGATIPESEATPYLARLSERDPDIWIVELETRDGTHPFPGEIFTA